MRNWKAWLVAILFVALVGGLSQARDRYGDDRGRPMYWSQHILDSAFITADPVFSVCHYSNVTDDSYNSGTFCYVMENQTLVITRFHLIIISTGGTSNVNMNCAYSIDYGTITASGTVTTLAGTIEIGSVSSNDDCVGRGAAWVLDNGNQSCTMNMSTVIAGPAYWRIYATDNGGGESCTATPLVDVIIEGELYGP